NTELQIADMIRKGSTKAAIILDFEHAGDDYQIEQQFRSQKTGTAANSKSVLKKNGEIIAEQAKGTYDALKKMLNMDEKNFQNCSYIRQGEVDALINAKPKDRQQMIDDLLRLGKLEEYRERAQESKKAVNRILRQENDNRISRQEKIETLRGQNLHEELNRRREAIEKINASVEKKRKEKETASGKLALLELKLKEIEDDKKEIETLKKDAADLGRKLDIEISKRDEALLEIVAAEKKEKEITEKSEKIRKGLNETKEVAAANELPKITETNIELFINAAKEAEKKSLEIKHNISEQAAVISANRTNIEKGILKNETDAKTLKETQAAIELQAEKHTGAVNAANAAVEGGFTKAGIEKNAFLTLFDELFKEFKEEVEQKNIIENAANAGEDAAEREAETADIHNMLFYSGVVKAEELPLPSDESLWNTLIGDIEKLEAFIAAKIKKEDVRLTDEEKKKASMKGELEEKEKGAEEIEKEIRRLNTEKEKTDTTLKTEQAEWTKKKKSGSDFEISLTEHAKKRNEKLKACPVLKETVPSSRYQLNDISAKDIGDAAEILSKKKESLVAEESGLKSEKSEIEKAVLKRETLLKAGKCPTCGQEITAAVHTEHGAGDEMKRLAGIKIRLEEIRKATAVNDPQAVLLKEIQKIDENVEKIRSEINTLSAEEKGKAELIEKYQKDLIENERQKAEWNARKVEASVFCDARKKDLERVEKRLSELKAESSRKDEKNRMLSERKKEFSNAAHSILRDYKTLESERKLSKESQKRMEEIEKAGEENGKNLQALKIELEKITAKEEEIKAPEREAVKNLEAKTEILSAAENLKNLINEKERIKVLTSGRKKAIEQQDTTIDNLKSQKSEKEMKAKNLAEKVATSGFVTEDGISAEEQKKRLFETMKALSEEISKWEQKRSDVDREIGMFENEIKQLELFEKESEALRNKTEFLAYAAKEVAALEEMYHRIRSDMRSKNIEALSQLLNEMFDLIYSNNSYSHLELDTDYNLKVHEKDGAVLEPKQLSGGERAIFNLALRCAIYRLLSFGFGENNTGKTTLPPLIFDEPTVFLDSGHIRQLIKLIEHMREDGVGQIIVVSHDESLIDSADENFKIEKDPLTNASAVVRG
ncbi:MAG: hypothetical protein FWE78_04160, partial [Methanimicrococcus sp.]|nr:hypothetical protein [Methanimicrococcus sp.]